MMLQAVKRVSDAQIYDITDYDNPADIDAVQDVCGEDTLMIAQCNNGIDTGDAIFDSSEPKLGSSLLGGDQEDLDSQVADFAGDNLVSAPKFVEDAALQIGYEDLLC